MATPSREQLQTLRAQLPPFAQAAPPADKLLACNQYYGLCFDGDIDYRAGTVQSGNYRLMLHQWQQPSAKANMLLVHGFTDHSGLFTHLISYGLSRGFNVLIFDLPGHGLSSGAPAEIVDFAEYGQAVADVFSAADLPELPWWVMAQSTGCAALMEFTRLAPWPFAACVMLAPLVRPANWQTVRLAHMLLHRFLRGVTRDFSANTSDGAFIETLKTDPLQSPYIPVVWVEALRAWLRRLQFTDLGAGPVLAIQGDDDQTVDWRYNIGKIPLLFPGSEVEYLPGAGHQLANESEVMRQTYLARVDAYLESKGLLDSSAEGPDGYTLTPYQQDFNEQIEVAEGIMKRYKNTLRELAK